MSPIVERQQSYILLLSYALLQLSMGQIKNTSYPPQYIELWLLKQVSISLVLCSIISILNVHLWLCLTFQLWVQIKALNPEHRICNLPQYQNIAHKVESRALSLTIASNLIIDKIFPFLIYLIQFSYLPDITSTTAIFLGRLQAALFITPL